MVEQHIPIHTTYPYINLTDILDKTKAGSAGMPQLIHVGGVSAAGKTTISSYLAERLPDARVLSIDSYLIAGLGKMTVHFDDTPPDPNRPYIGGISPRVWELDLLTKHLGALRRNEPVEVPIFDQTTKDRVGSEEFIPGRYIILEGGHAFGDELRDTANYRLLVTTPLHDRITRKIVRTFLQYRRTDLDDIVGRYLTKDEPVWQHYRNEHSALADQVITNPSRPAEHYEQAPEVDKPVPLIRRFNLIPMPDTGVLHDGETFYVGHSEDGIHYVGYAINDRTLVHLPLNADIVRRLATHYRFNEVAP